MQRLGFSELLQEAKIAQAQNHEKIKRYSNRKTEIIAIPNHHSTKQMKDYNLGMHETAYITQMINSNRFLN